MLTAHLRHLQPTLLFAQNADDLLLAEPASLHSSVPLSGDLSPENWTAVNEKIPLGLAIDQPGESAMKRSRFSEQQIAFILHQAEEGVAVEDVCRKAGISRQTYYRWRKRYGSLMPSEMKRLKAAGGGELPAEEACGGSLAGQSHAAGCRQKNVRSAPSLQGFLSDKTTDSLRKWCPASAPMRQHG
jgi:hypothetical protein